MYKIHNISNNIFAGGWEDGAGIDIKGSSWGSNGDFALKVINNEISGNEGRGINIWGGNAITIEGNKIRNSSGYLGIGLYIRESSSNVIIKNNLVEGSQEYGIAVGSGSNHNISGNQILNNGRAGIQLGNVATQPGGGGGGDGIVEKNIIKGNGAGTSLSEGFSRGSSFKGGVYVETKGSEIRRVL